MVILSTHIVEDVSDLCTRMAIMGNGRILVEGEPAALIGKLEGRLWKQVVRDRRSRRVAGTPADRIDAAHRADAQRSACVGAERPDSLDPAEPTLEDVYFATLQQHGIDVALWTSGVFREIFRFECRHQLGSPLFIATALIFFTFAFLGMASEQVSIGDVT